jgi:hypothetical protein
VLPGISGFEPPLSETPSTRLQAPEKFQISNAKPQNQMPGQTASRSVFEPWSLVLLKGVKKKRKEKKRKGVGQEKVSVNGIDISLLEAQVAAWLASYEWNIRKGVSS